MYLWTCILTLKQLFCESPRSISVGIDLGTTNSAVFVLTPDHNKPLCVEYDGINATMPSSVKYTFERTGAETNLVSEVGVRPSEAIGDLRNLVTSSKRIIGLSKKDIDLNDRLTEMYRSGAFNIEPQDPSKAQSPMVVPLYEGDKVAKRIHAVQVSAAILAKLMDAVHRAFGSVIEGCIVTVPAYFNENQIESTKEACRIAALPLSRTLNEPVAAAFAYQMQTGAPDLPPTLVFDMGGGTLDISVVEYEEGVLEVLCYAGDNFLGGNDVDHALYAHFLAEFEKQRPADERTKLRLRHFAEAFKIELCERQLQMEKEEKSMKVDAVLSKDFFYTIASAHTFTMSCSELGKVAAPVFDRVRACLVDPNGRIGILDRLKATKRDPSSIGKVLLVGGSTRLPHIRSMLKEMFGDRVCDALNPDTCVAEGACWYAGALAGRADLPAHVDVVSVPIGICVGENIFQAIINEGATVPAIGSEIFTTSVDLQTRVVIKVAQGPYYQFSDAQYLGEFNLDIEKPAPKGVPKIKVTISIDKDRFLNVVAEDMLTKKEAKITFDRSSHTLSKEEVDRMIAEREARKESDEILRQRDEALRILDTYTDALKGRVSMSKLPEADKTDLLERIQKEVSWMQSEKQVAVGTDIIARYEALKAHAEPILAKYEVPKDHAKPSDTEKVREDL